jgi:hypothetical protein
MNKQEYMKMYYEEPEEIVVTKDDVKEYIKTIADAANALKESMYELEYGKLRDGKYQHRITSCAVRTDSYGNMEIHMYEGIELLAKALDRILEKVPRESAEYPWEYELRYFGVRFFQLIKAEGKQA